MSVKVKNRLAVWVQKTCKQMVIYPQNHVTNRAATHSTAQPHKSFYPISLAQEKMKVWFLLNAS